jgi:hypothetical protein
MEDQMASQGSKKESSPKREINGKPEFGWVEGYVRDIGLKKDKNTPVADAVIDCIGPFDAQQKTALPAGIPVAASAHTDAKGHYITEDLKPGWYLVRSRAFIPKENWVNVMPVCRAQQNFELNVGFHIACLPQTGPGVGHEIDPCSVVEAGVPIKIQVSYNQEALANEVVITFATHHGVLVPLPNCVNETMLLSHGVTGPCLVSATMAEANSPFMTVESSIVFVAVQPRSVDGSVNVTLQRSAATPTIDLGLWAAIRTHAKAISFGGLGVKGKGRVLRGYQGFIEQVLCGDASGISVPTDPCEQHPGLQELKNRSNQAKQLPMHGMAAYELLKTATEIFLLWNCGVAMRDRDTFGNPITTDDEEQARSGLDIDQVTTSLENYLGKGRLPYIERVVQTAFPDYVRLDRNGVVAPPSGGFTPPNDVFNRSVFCTGVLTPRADCVCLIELIWSYWHEEAMLVQTMNAISQRFQNVRAMSERDPLAHVTIDPLRPMNNLLWGYVQDEQNRLTVKRRGAEYDHEYGLTLRGKAVPTLRPADSRSKFLEGYTRS